MIFNSNFIGYNSYSINLCPLFPTFVSIKMIDDIVVNKIGTIRKLNVIKLQRQKYVLYNADSSMKNCILQTVIIASIFSDVKYKLIQNTQEVYNLVL